MRKSQISVIPYCDRNYFILLSCVSCLLWLGRGPPTTQTLGHWIHMYKFGTHANSSAVVACSHDIRVDSTYRSMLVAIFHMCQCSRAWILRCMFYLMEMIGVYTFSISELMLLISAASLDLCQCGMCVRQYSRWTTLILQMWKIICWNVR